MSVAPPLAPPPVLGAPRRPLLAALVVVQVPGAAVGLVGVAPTLLSPAPSPPGLELVVALVRRPLWRSFVLQVVVGVGAAVGGEGRPLGAGPGVPVPGPAPAALGRPPAQPLLLRPAGGGTPVPGAPPGAQAVAAPVGGPARRPLGAVGGAAGGEGGAVGAE